MVLLIDTDPTDTLYFDQITQLEGVQYVLEFWWSDRESAWYLTFYDQDGNPLAAGIRLVIGWPLLRRFVDPRLPPGVLMAVDMTGMGREIETSLDLGNRVRLTYVTADDDLLSAAAA